MDGWLLAKIVSSYPLLVPRRLPNQQTDSKGLIFLIVANASYAAAVLTLEVHFLLIISESCPLFRIRLA